MAVIYLVRHGQASFGAEDYDVLSETGVRQGARTGQALRGRVGRVDAIVSGTLRRHLATAEACLEAMGETRAPTVDAGWDEYDHDDVMRVYEPRFVDRAALAAELATAADPSERFREIFEGALARWVRGEHEADYRETWEAFVLRSLAALERVRASLGRGGTALVFTSGGPIGAVCGALLGLDPMKALGVAASLVNAGLTKIVVGSRAPWVSSFNEHAHLEVSGAGLLTYR